MSRHYGRRYDKYQQFFILDINAVSNNLDLILIVLVVRSVKEERKIYVVAVL